MAVVAFGIALFAAAPSWAGAKEDDVAKMYAEWAAIPDGIVAPAVADALAFEANWGPGPVLQEVVYEMPAQRPGDGRDGNFDWTERAALSQIAPSLFKLESGRCWFFSIPDAGIVDYHCLRDWDTHILDRSGLLVPFEKSVMGSSAFRVAKMSALSVIASQAKQDNAIDSPFLSFVSTIDKGTEGDNNTGPHSRSEYDCQISIQTPKADVNCKISEIGVDYRNKAVTMDPSTESSSLFWDTVFHIYLLKDGYDCYEDVCHGTSHKIVDYRPAGGDWHSKTVSAALSAPDRARALALFSAGFDAYKSGDFVGAVALLQKGLTIDPANHLAYFTLAECARSAWINNQNDYWERSVAFYYYHRTVDLAPDSPEGVRAQGRLDGGLK